MKVLEVIQEAEVNADPKLGPDGKPLKITDPTKGIKVTAPTTTSTSTGNWQTKLLSRDSWDLIFHLANVYSWKSLNNIRMNKRDLDKWYRIFVAGWDPRASTESWTGKTNSLTDLSLGSSKTPELIVAEIIGRIQNVLGITVGPGWKVGPAKPTKELPNYKEGSWKYSFWEYHRMIVGTTAAGIDYNVSPNKVITQQDRDDNYTPLEDGEANAIAKELFDQLTKGWVSQWWNDVDNLAKVKSAYQKILHEENWKQVQNKYRQLAAEDVRQERLTGILRDDLKELIKNNPAAQQDLDKHIKGIGMTPIMDDDMSNWVDVRTDLQVELIESPNGTEPSIKLYHGQLLAKFSEANPKIKAYLGYGVSGMTAEKRQPRLAKWRLYNENAWDEMKKEHKKGGNSIPVSQIISIFQKHSNAYKATVKSLI